jgi:hypothetical protein
MSQNDESRTEKIVESAFGALGDWLELVRQHENDRRARLAAEARGRRDVATRLVMGLLSAAVLAYLFCALRLEI